MTGKGKEEEGGWERIIRVVGSVTGSSSLPRERPLQGGWRGTCWRGLPLSLLAIC